MEKEEKELVQRDTAAPSDGHPDGGSTLHSAAVIQYMFYMTLQSVLAAEVCQQRGYAELLMNHTAFRCGVLVQLLHTTA
jgi:hypothetical protein